MVVMMMMMMVVVVVGMMMIIQFFIIYMPGQQLQIQLQTQYSVDTVITLKTNTT
jgi:hypothetical protein